MTLACALRLNAFQFVLHKKMVSESQIGRVVCRATPYIDPSVYIATLTTCSRRPLLSNLHGFTNGLWREGLGGCTCGVVLCKVVTCITPVHKMLILTERACCFSGAKVNAALVLHGWMEQFRHCPCWPICACTYTLLLQWTSVTPVVSFCTIGPELNANATSEQKSMFSSIKQLAWLTSL